jgi:hypothetical protein
MPKLEPLDMAVLEDGEKPVYVIDPSVMYPAVIARFKEIREGESPNEVLMDGHPNYLTNWRRRIRKLDDDALDNALKPRDQFSDPVEIANRAVALQTAWKYFRLVLRLAGAKTFGAGENKVLRVHLINENSGEGKSDYRD